MVATRAEAQTIERFAGRYQCCAPAMIDVEREALGSDFGSTGYTTREEADRIAVLLGVGPGDWLADIGAGSGWPGLYIAASTGCHVVGSDVTVDGLRRARDRAASDGVITQANFVRATGRSQPFRDLAFDAVVHTDVLCCLGPKLATLRACRRILRPGGRLVFTTIYVAPGLDPVRHRRAVRAGPWQVTTRRPYAELVRRAEFDDVVEFDVTADYARTQRAWYQAYERRAADLRRLTSDREFATAQADRRATRDAIEQGLLRRSLFAAVR